MAINFADIIQIIKNLITDGDKLAKFKEIIVNLKELIPDLKEIIVNLKELISDLKDLSGKN